MKRLTTKKVRSAGRMGCAASVLSIVLAVGPTFAGPEAMTPQEARHFLARTGFGASAKDISSFTGLSYEAAVERLLAELRTSPVTPMPAWSSGWAYPYEAIFALDQTATDVFYTNRYLEIDALQAWWMGEMVATPSPLTERLVLFWHDHFATSFENDENPQWIAQQNQFFRAHAAGNFADLARGILTDPAMLSYLSNVENSVDAPNENLAREYMELFTMGQGRGYTEQDVREVARALTGHSIAEFGGGDYVFYPDDHDDATKTILGRSGRFDAPDLPGLVLSHPDFGPYIVEKLWRTFISDTPDPAEVERLSDLWIENDLELRPLLRALFLTDAFWAAENRGRLVKSPVELTVGTMRTFGRAGVPNEALDWVVTDMGQELFFPPNVGGWDHGISWINDASAVARATVMADMLFDLQADPDEAMMTAAPAAAEPAPFGDLSQGDLRVGRVFASSAWADEDGDRYMGSLLILFDVSFGGATFRSMPMFLEQTEGEAPEVSFYVGDCAPACLYGSDVRFDPSDPWIWLPVTADGLDDLDGLSDDGARYVAAVLGHLPALVGSTDQQPLWSATPWEYETPATLDQVKTMAASAAAAGYALVGGPSGEVVFAHSRPNVMGLQGLETVRSGGDIDVLYDVMQAAMGHTNPPVPYASLDDWAKDLPAGITVAEALISVPLQTLDPGAFDDVETLIERLLLTPEYQVN